MNHVLLSSCPTCALHWQYVKLWARNFNTCTITKCGVYRSRPFHVFLWDCVGYVNGISKFSPTSPTHSLPLPVYSMLSHPMTLQLCPNTPPPSNKHTHTHHQLLPLLLSGLVLINSLHPAGPRSFLQTLCLFCLVVWMCVYVCVYIVLVCMWVYGGLQLP